MNTYKTEDLPKDKIIEFFKLHWGSPEMVISSGVYDCSTLDGFAIVKENNIIGLITYVIKDYDCEIISLDSIEEGKGIGTSLVKEVENLAFEKNCKFIRLITTNDNLLALKFYQKRGFVISKVINNAVEKARKLKPEIPLIGNDGIPIRDEIELKKLLD
ncbi:MULTISPECIES: GNAT family N-acetyltransferase [unclassified Bacillus (in: firmicutes)]|uniref:GNAT family N-acetyltransferase n=1 Tax=unclassified Bacillus (in: firmicutes) TaxID=185979 RepID=UPI001BEB8EA0|nr:MULTISPECIES: GNAT family N-acetyltransferase [unclassified Bacillus (in: firmicutes)]MBT2640403.1 GNAT family N-acetyltransferase [Bacillus sp. ISL-39]MBT2663334.1 GNAT family N-acetyltransferase [Bacillus sp. ISL-45]